MYVRGWEIYPAQVWSTEDDRLWVEKHPYGWELTDGYGAQVPELVEAGCHQLEPELKLSAVFEIAQQMMGPLARLTRAGIYAIDHTGLWLENLAHNSSAMWIYSQDINDEQPWHTIMEPVYDELNKYGFSTRYNAIVALEEELTKWADSSQPLPQDLQAIVDVGRSLDADD